MSERDEPRVIKRYANRKLYDMSESCYITHEEIAVLVRNGEEVRIIDNRTQEDLTSATLTQILLDEEKRVKRPLPIDTLRNFFQSGGDFIQKKIKQPVASLREEAEKNVRRVFGRRDANDALGPDGQPLAPTAEASLAPSLQRPPTDPAMRSAGLSVMASPSTVRPTLAPSAAVAGKPSPSPSSAFKPAIASSAAVHGKPKPAEAIRDALEDRWLEIQHTFAQLDFPKRIAELERRVQTLEAELTALKGQPLEGAEADHDEGSRSAAFADAHEGSSFGAKSAPLDDDHV